MAKTLESPQHAWSFFPVDGTALEVAICNLCVRHLFEQSHHQAHWFGLAAFRAVILSTWGSTHSSVLLFTPEELRSRNKAVSHLRANRIGDLINGDPRTDSNHYGLTYFSMAGAPPNDPLTLS